MDFKVSNDDLNYSTLQMDDNDDEFRARLFAFKAANKPGSRKSLKPYTVSDGNETLDKMWKNYLVLLINDKGDNKLTKVCFPKNTHDNFAIVTGINTSCAEKIEKIKSYKIMDDETANEDNENELKVEEKKLKNKSDNEDKEQKEYNEIIESLHVDEVKIKPKKQKNKMKKKVEKEELEEEALFKFK
jgi:hypothetical protein